MPDAERELINPMRYLKARYREWLLKTVEGREIHDRWFSSIENHTVLRYVEGWGRVQADE